MLNYKFVTWDEAEALYPECSAAWDRDMTASANFEYKIVVCTREDASFVMVREDKCRDSEAGTCLCRVWQNNKWIRVEQLA